MRQRYTYRISVRSGDGWQQTHIAELASQRDPQSIARGLIEQWIITNAHELAGGARVFIFPGARNPPPEAQVAIQVFRGRLHDHDQNPAATAYLGHRQND